jgi:glyoxylase-like metal-dependent hydrolase (beta-lactamase superfamily II)
MPFLQPGVIPLGVGGGGSAAPQQSPAPDPHRFTVGDFEITALSDGSVELALDKLLSGIDADDVRTLLERSGDTGPLKASINAFLIDTGSQLVLVDTGAGKLFAPRAGGLLLSSLRSAGYGPEQIDTILLTHVHADHSGGLTVDGVPVFPNAQVYVEQADKDHWFSAEAEERAPAHRKHSFPQGRASLKPYLQAGRLHTFSGPTQLMPGVRSVPAPGHTPGHTMYVIESRGQKLVLWGDIMHAAPIQFPRPDVTVKFDSDEHAAALQRKRVFEEAATEGYLIAAAHVSFPGVGHLQRQGTGYAWRQVDAG